VRRPPARYFVCDSEPVVPVVPDSDVPDSDFFEDEPVFFAAFFEDFALCFEPVFDPEAEPLVSSFALEPVADDSDPEEPLPIDPDEPLAEDFFDVAVFLWCLWCFALALVPLVPVSLLPFMSLEPCMPLLEPCVSLPEPCMPLLDPCVSPEPCMLLPEPPMLPCSCVAELCASAAPASITAAATAIHFMSNIRSSARLLLDRDAELRPARNTAGPRNDGFAARERQGIAPCT
jgi:hypothetical protein